MSKQLRKTIISVTAIVFIGILAVGTLVGCNKDMISGKYYIDISGEKVSKVFESEDPEVFKRYGIARVDKTPTYNYGNKEVYFIDKNCKAIGDVSFKITMVEVGTYDNKAIFISGTDDGIEILDEKMKLISKIPYDMDGVTDIIDIIGPPGANGLFPIKDKQTELWGYMTIDGEMVIKADYILARAFTDDGVATVCSKDMLRGVINEKGEYIIEPQYRGLTDFREGRAFAQLNEKEGARLINLENQALSDDKFGLPGYTVYEKLYSDGLARVEDKTTGLYGYIDTEGEYVIDPIYKNAQEFTNGFATVKNKDGLDGVINTKGEEVVPCQYEDILNISEEGIVPVKKDGLYGYYSVENGWIIEPKYKDASPFNSGLAWVEDVPSEE